MKALVTALALAALVGASASVVQLAPANDHVAGQRHGGQYQGYPLTDWYRTETVW